MGRTIRTKTNTTTKRPGSDATIGRLAELAEFCKEHKIQKLSVDGISIEFNPAAFIQAVDVKSFESAVKTFEKKASENYDAKKEFEETLFWSAR